MTLKHEVALLKKLSLFSGIGDAPLELLAFGSRRLSYDAGHVLVEEGEPLEGAFLVTEGSLIAKTGAETALRWSEGSLIAETALFRPCKARATLRADGPAEVLALGRDAMERLVGEYPDLGTRLADGFAQRLGAIAEDLGTAASAQRHTG